MARQLRRVRKLAGTDEIAAGLPAIHRITDAVYLPLGADNRWGLFEHGCQRATNPATPAEPADLTIAGRAPDVVYLYINLMTDHYGHFITDVLSRLWPLLDWQGERPRLLHHGPKDPAGWQHADFIGTMLAGIGASIDDLVSFDETVLIPSVLVPEPSLNHGIRAHPVMAALCERIGDPLRRGVTARKDAPPLYLSKAGLATGIHKARGEDVLVSELERRGVEIVLPERLSFPDQVRLLAAGRTLLGVAGSALHTTMFAGRRQRIVALHWSNYLNANFALLDRLNENRAYYYCPEVIDLARGGDFLLSWTIPNPKEAAEEMLRSAEAFDELDARDDEDDRLRALAFNRLDRRIARLGARIGRRLAGLIGGGPPRDA